jgi:hypothetical protein
MHARERLPLRQRDHDHFRARPRPQQRGRRPAGLPQQRSRNGGQAKADGVARRGEAAAAGSVCHCAIVRGLRTSPPSRAARSLHARGGSTTNNARDRRGIRGTNRFDGGEIGECLPSDGGTLRGGAMSAYATQTTRARRAHTRKRDGVPQAFTDTLWRRVASPSTCPHPAIRQGEESTPVQADLFPNGPALEESGPGAHPWPIFKKKRSRRTPGHGGELCPARSDVRLSSR